MFVLGLRDDSLCDRLLPEKERFPDEMFDFCDVLRKHEDAEGGDEEDGSGNESDREE